MMDFAFTVVAMATFGAIVLSRLVERMLNEFVLELFGESPALRARSGTARERKAVVSQRRRPAATSVQKRSTMAISSSRRRRSRATPSTSSSASWTLRSFSSSA
jgi:hypothetical protein